MADEHDSELLEHMRRDGFLKTVQNAETAAAEADRLRETLDLWAKRLSPYLDTDPDMTIAEALEAYKHEHTG